MAEPEDPLAEMFCPACGVRGGSFLIEIGGTVDIGPTQMEIIEWDWTEDSRIWCQACGHQGLVSGFHR